MELILTALSIWAGCYLIGLAIQLIAVIGMGFEAYYNSSFNEKVVAKVAPHAIDYNDQTEEFIKLLTKKM